MTSTLTIHFIIPLICQLINGTPHCNVLQQPTKIDVSTWYESTTNSTIRLDNGKLIIETID